jgi:hypothetical protein
VVRTHTQTVHNRACGSLAARTGGGLAETHRVEPRHNYGLGTWVTFTLTRLLGIEGEIGTMIATTSDLQFGDLDSNTKAPNFLSYTAILVVSLDRTLGRAVWHRRNRRPHDVRAAGGRRPERRDIPRDELRLRREVQFSEQPVGTAWRRAAADPGGSLVDRRVGVTAHLAAIRRPRRPGWRASHPRRAATSRLASATMFSGVKPNFF